MAQNAVSEDGLVIPLIDFSGFLDGCEVDRKETAKAILEGFQTAGFIYLKNIPISAESRATAFSMSSHFFTLPEEDKLALSWTTPAANRGYSAFGREKTSLLTDKAEIDALRNTTPDIKESLEIGREGEEGHPNLWPDEQGTGLEGFRAKMTSFFSECKQLHIEIMRAIGIGMGLDDKYFDPYVDKGDNTLRLLHYPPVKADAFKTAVRAGHHSDYGSITILFQDDRGGLQICSPNGRFVDATPIENTLVINAGDFLARWSNDTIKSTVHRVVEPPVKSAEYPARYSIAYFCNPNFDSDIEALPGTYATESEKKVIKGLINKHKSSIKHMCKFALYLTSNMNPTIKNKMKQKTLLLCFIHGFKGDESTFGEDYRFTKVLRDIVAAELPDVNIETLVYPRYETRGNLGECVGRFRDWLQEKVIDLEVDAGTQSPTIDPSVHTILVGHSMGGIVAAETVIALTSDIPILPTSSSDSNAASTSDATGCTTGATDASVPFSNGLMFPYVQGVLAFDTPFLGLSPGIIAHGAEEKYMTASSVAGQLSDFWSRNAPAAASAASASNVASGQSASAATTATAAAATAAAAATGSSRWGTWGKLAIAAGGAAVVAAGAGAAWYNRDNISSGIGWVGSHLEFVGVLGKPEELRKRVAYMVRLQKEQGTGFVNMYTLLGNGAAKANYASLLYSKDRTFCVLPTGNAPSGTWRAVRNNKAGDEITAHINMFESSKNSGYDDLVVAASDYIAAMVKTTDWYKLAGQKAIKSASESLI
ncbi:2-oxoglutarate-Fe(II) type oxidoreductase [Ceratocystis fimbriata CBS 114723]|uniref:2-oxoglutarate-Fe(II) type oxidoreductase n=1 Tax=Ceratocystis fimbriata CBS 114723 TaxID=1035309 RepID=A0A2C5WXF5_9PEZI|nr:2-oxoglutarate-Fe(II) type oxidoreductase [Ceratocystis fimbriata CBS 114723]